MAVGLHVVAEAHRARLDLADGIGEVGLAEHEQVDLAHRDVAHLVQPAARARLGGHVDPVLGARLVRVVQLLGQLVARLARGGQPGKGRRGAGVQRAAWQGVQRGEGVQHGSPLCRVARLLHAHGVHVGVAAQPRREVLLRQRVAHVPRAHAQLDLLRRLVAAVLEHRVRRARARGLVGEVESVAVEAVRGRERHVQPAVALALGPLLVDPVDVLHVEAARLVALAPQHVVATCHSAAEASSGGGGAGYASVASARAAETKRSWPR